MAEYTLSTRGLDTGRGSKGLSPSLLSSRAVAGQTAAAQIDPNAANIKFTPMPIPQIVPDQTAEGVQHLMGRLAQAAVEYQERQDTYASGLLVDKFTEMTERELNGWVDEDGTLHKGLTAMKLGKAEAAHALYTDRVEENFQTMLRNAPPSVREKALLRMSQIKRQYASQAASHRVGEFEKLEKNREIKQFQETAKRIAANPQLLNRPATEGGVTDLDKVRALFPDDPAAQAEAIDKIITDATDIVYYNEMQKALRSDSEEERTAARRLGVNAAAAFYEELGKRHLTDPAVANQIQGQLISWDNDAFIRETKLEADREQEALDAAEARREVALAEIRGAIFVDVKPTKQQFQALIQKYPTESSEITSMYNAVWGDEDVPFDPAYYNYALRIAETGTDEQFETLIDFSRFDSTNTGRLLTARKDRKNANRDKGMDFAESFLEDTFAQLFGFDESARDITASQAIRLVQQDVLEDNMTPEAALIKRLPFYVHSITEQELGKLPPLPTGASPNTPEDLLKEVHNVTLAVGQRDTASPYYMGKTEYHMLLLNAQLYLNAFRDTRSILQLTQQKIEELEKGRALYNE